MLGDLLIVEAFEIARDLSRGGFRGPAVTLEGDVFQPGGTISGGKSSRDQGAIELKRRLSEKEAAADALRSERSALQKDIALLDEEERRASERSRLLFEKRRGLEEELRAVESARDESESAVSRYEGRRNEVLLELSGCGKVWLENRKKIEALSENARSATKQPVKLNWSRILKRKDPGWKSQQSVLKLQGGWHPWCGRRRRGLPGGSWIWTGAFRGCPGRIVAQEEAFRRRKSVFRYMEEPPFRPLPS